MSTDLPMVRTRRGRGRVAPKNLDHLREVSFAKHAHTLRAIRKKHADPPAAYDLRTASPQSCPPLDETNDDQGQCGSCWDFSGTVTAEAALMRGGVLTSSQRLSKEYTLDCGQNGGCNGDDNTTVLKWAQETGLPLSSDYGPYSAGNGSPGQCKYVSGMKLFKIDSWGFADSNGGQGVTPTADIKAAILEYGLVGCAVAAGNDWDNVGPNSTITGTSTSIDHDVALIGWDDNHDNGDGSKGAWIMRNSWGPSWGNNGYCWIKYGADSIGTETVFAAVKSPVPPPPPPPPVCVNTLTVTTPVPTGTISLAGVGSLTMCQQLTDGQYSAVFTPITPPTPPTPTPSANELADVGNFLIGLSKPVSPPTPPPATEIADVIKYLQPLATKK